MSLTKYCPKGIVLMMVKGNIFLRNITFLLQICCNILLNWMNLDQPEAPNTFEVSPALNRKLDFVTFEDTF